MVKTLLKLFGLGPSVNYSKLLQDGAIILDVRTSDEFKDGHIQGSINIPIEALRDNMHRLASKQMTVIACCTDGGKSWYAKNLLDSTGYKHVYDAGSWIKLQRRLAKGAW